MFRTIIKVLVGLLVLFGIGYGVGPTPDYEPVNGKIEPLNIGIDKIESFINIKEAKILDIKPENQARVIWADSSKQKTEYSLVYLHGFSASQEEGDPIHQKFSERYGCNLFLSRLEDHGRRDSNTFINLTPESLMASAREAIAIGKEIGEKVIVMSCSTGSTLSAFLAAESPEYIHSQIMYSPNIDVYDPLAVALTLPWGKQIASLTMGGDYNKVRYSKEGAQYWNEQYHINGLIALKDLINQTMIEKNFKKIDQPLFVGYYYKNEEEQDKVVSVERMHDFYNQVSTSSDNKRMVAFPNAGRHVIASHVQSSDYETVMKETFKFADEILGLKAVSKKTIPITVE